MKDFWILEECGGVPNVVRYTICTKEEDVDKLVEESDFGWTDVYYLANSSHEDLLKWMSENVGIPREKEG